MIEIQNRADHPVTAHLTHDVCRAIGRCLCSRQAVSKVTTAMTNGRIVRGAETVNRRIPASLSLSARGSKGDRVTVHEGYLVAPEVAALVKADWKVVPVVESPPAEPPAAPDEKAPVAADDAAGAEDPGTSQEQAPTRRRGRQAAGES